jgi:hypothetical protein
MLMRDPVVAKSIVMSGSILALSVAAAAHVPHYKEFQLQVRSNLCANEAQGFNLPCNVFFNSSTPAINDYGQVAVKLDVVGNSQGVWFGAEGAGSIAYTSPAGAFLSDVGLNNAGYVVFPQTDAPPNGIYFYDSVTNASGLRTSLPFGTSAWGSPDVNIAGHIGFRATLGGSGQAYYSFDGTPMLALHAAEAGLDSESPFSFLFSPAFNDDRQIAAHVRLGLVGQVGNSQPDEIRLFQANGSSTIIARDADAQAGSPFAAFDSSRPAATNDGRVAFIANLAGGGRGVFLGDGTGSIQIATTATAGVTGIDFFPPAVNDHGLVAFRGTDNNNLPAIFVGNGSVLRRVIGKNDLVMTDLGMARIAQHDNSPVFGGSIGINSHADIVFSAALTPADNTLVEWGSGVFIAISDINPADINSDEVVNVADLLLVLFAWGNCPNPPQTCPADIAPLPHGDGVVNVLDLLMVISNWG